MPAAKTTEAKFTFDVLKRQGPVLVDFYAEWCSQCRRLSPVLDELAEDWAGRVEVRKVDVERSPHLVDRYGIRRIPTLVLFHGGEEQARLVEVSQRSVIEAAVEDALNEAVTP